MKRILIIVSILTGVTLLYSCDATNSDEALLLEEMLPNNSFYYLDLESDTAYGKITFGDLNTNAELAFYELPCESSEPLYEPYEFEYEIASDELLIVDGDSTEVVEINDESFQLQSTEVSGDTDLITFESDCNNLQ